MALPFQYQEAGSPSSSPQFLSLWQLIAPVSHTKVESEPSKHGEFKPSCVSSVQKLSANEM